jgi:hypothetical protein
MCVCVCARKRACVCACVRVCVRVQAASAEMQAQLLCEKEARAQAENSLAMRSSEVSTLSAEIVSLYGLHETKIAEMAARAYEEAYEEVSRRDGKARQLEMEATLQTSMARARSNETLEQERESLLGDVENWRARVTELQHELQRVSYTFAQVQTR